MCLSGLCSICNPNWTFEKEPTMAVDWTKPLIVKNFHNKEVRLVGCTFFGDKILETKNGTLFKASAQSGRILDNRDFYVTNRLEPWAEVWKTFDQNPMHFSEEDYFKLVFELGRTWTQKNSV